MGRLPLVLLATLTAIAALTSVGCGRGEPPPEPRAPTPRAHAHHHRFDDAASWSKVFDDPERDAWQKPDAVVAAMRIAPGMKVADVGAGTGYFESRLSRAVGPAGEVHAVDLEPDMVRWIEERARREGLANVKARLGTPADPGLPAGAIDRILLVDTWHHIEDRPAYVRALARALAAGGAVYVVDFTKESPHGPPPHARVPPAEVMADLAAASLDAELVTGAGLPYQYVVAGRKR